MDADFIGKCSEHKLTYRIRIVGEGGKTQVYCPACSAAAAERVAASIRPETKQTAADPDTDTVATPQARIKERSEEHTSGTPVTNAHLVCRLLLAKKKNTSNTTFLCKTKHKQH